MGFVIGAFALAAMMLRPLAGDLADRRGRRPLVLLGTAIFVLTLYVSYGGLAALLPLFAAQRRLGNPGLFFTVYALVGLAVRSPAGRLSDRLGRR